MSASTLQAFILSVPALGLLATRRRGLPRTTALALASWMFVLACLLLHLQSGSDGGLALSLGGLEIFWLDALNLWLLPFTCLLYLAVLLCTPRANRRPGSAERLLLAMCLDLTFLSVRSAWALMALWPLTLLPLLFEVRAAGGSGRLLRILLIYQVPGCLLFMVGAAALAVRSDSPPLWAFLAVTLGIVLRKAMVPVHQWLPELFESGPMGHAIAFCTTQLGAYATVRLLAPQAPEALLTTLGTAALITSVYGACLACGQKSVRGAYAGLFLGQSSLVFGGLQCTTEAGLAGGLSLWISGGLALTGLGLTIWALEARRGPMRLSGFHGGYERTPLLANAFLILGLTCVGFPGTLGFVSEELLLDGTIHLHPHIGILAAVAGGLNAITVLRAYFCLFCGRKTDYSVDQSLRLRERVAVLTLVVLLLGLGLAPQQFVASRWLSAHQILQQRAQRIHGSGGVHSDLPVR